MTAMTDVVISARNIGKRYEIFDSGRARLLNTLWPRYRAGMQEIWALQDIDFENDQLINAMDSYTLKTTAPQLKHDEEAFFEMTVCPLLEAGNYLFSISLGQPAEIGGAGTVVDKTPWLGPLQVLWDYHQDIPSSYGMVGLQATARIVLSRQDVVA